jgi:diguanylate cyclase (GGDEF)-like protein
VPEHDKTQSIIRRLEQLHEFHFELASAPTIDETCRRLVDRGRYYVGVDRIGLWFLDEDDPGWFHGSFGIDESGDLRDERTARIPLNSDIYDEHFFRRRVQYRRLVDSANFNARQEVVGKGDLVVAPMWNGTESIGALSADNLLTARPLTDEDCQMIALIARMAGHLVTIRRTEEKLQRLAAEDGLTGLFNRNTGLRLLQQQIAAALRSNLSLAVAFIDLDGLKRINDSEGHAVGDRYIREIAGLMEEVKRTSDEVCRMGGDEFMMILPDTTLDEAHRVMQRLTAAAGASKILTHMGPGPWFSCGIAELTEIAPARPATDGETETDTLVQQLIHRADFRMYEEKRRHYHSRHDFDLDAGTGAD